MAADDLENRAQGHILPAQDVAFAHDTLFQGQKMPFGDVIDMRHVEPGIDIGGHPAGGRVDDHLAGRRRLYVARPDGRRRIDDDDRQSLRTDQLV